MQEGQRPQSRAGQGGPPRRQHRRRPSVPGVAVPATASQRSAHASWRRRQNASHGWRCRCAIPRQGFGIHDRSSRQGLGGHQSAVHAAPSPGGRGHCARPSHAAARRRAGCRGSTPEARIRTAGNGLGSPRSRSHSLLRQAGRPTRGRPGCGAALPGRRGGGAGPGPRVMRRRRHGVTRGPGARGRPRRV